jgi:hypothetical protein
MRRLTNPYRVSALALACILSGAPAFAQEGSRDVPRLVLQITVDQLRGI